MTTGFGFCAKCGTPRIAAEQKFCAKCGSALAAVPSAPAAAAAPPPPLPAIAVAAAPPPPVVVAPVPAADAPAVPPPWAQAPVAPPAAPPTAPPPWAQAPVATSAPAQGVPPAPPMYTGEPPAYPPPPAPGAPGMPSAGFKITPKLIGLGAIVLAVIVGVAILLNMGGSSSSGITISPSNFSCSSKTQVTISIRLPASVKTGDSLTWKTDGKTALTTSMALLGFLKQGDGTWLYTSTDTAGTACSDYTAMGSHTIAIYDAGGNVLAQGSFTITP